MVRNADCRCEVQVPKVNPERAEDTAVITDTWNCGRRRAAGSLALIAVAVGLTACSHVQKFWPWHHAPVSAPSATGELLVVPAPGGAAPVLAQTWDRNALRVDLTALAGDGELTLRPAPGHEWPIRLEFAVRPGTFKRLEVRGEQRVVISVPEAGPVVVLPVPQGTYSPSTLDLTLHYGS
jgi:hypothetical protein